jgi:hypothetical protein
MHQATKIFSTLVVILPLTTMGFQQTSTGSTTCLRPWSTTTGSCSLFPQRTRQITYQRSRHSMAPFWRSSSSPDNENDDDDDEKADNTTDEPKASPDESSSTITGGGSSATVPMDEVAMASVENEENSKPLKKEKHQEGLLELLNDMGQSFKPKAETAVAKGYQSDGQGLKVFYATKACVYYMLFIFYRAYRGLFILMPAVFRKVYQKMELAMNANDLTLIDSVETADAPSTTPERVTWRTKLTVGILASVVTTSYVLGAAFRMAKQFAKTITHSRSVPKSFEAAADELVTYEDKVSKIGKINGENKMEPGGFAP